MFLQKCVDLRNRDAHAAIGVAGFPAKDGSCDRDQRNHRQRHQPELPVQNENGDHDAEQREDVAKDRNDAGGKQLVEDVDIGDHTCDQAADRIVVVE